MNYQAPVITVPDVHDQDLSAKIEELNKQGYMVTQRKRREQYNRKSDKPDVIWTLKAKKNTPPPKVGRILED